MAPFPLQGALDGQEMASPPKEGKNLLDAQAEGPVLLSDSTKTGVWYR